MIKASATIALQHDAVFSPFPASQFSEALDWLVDSGFNGAELIISEPKDVDREALCTALDKRNLLVSTIATGQSLGLEGLSLTSLEPDIREKAQKRMCEHIDLSSELPGCPNVTVGLLRGKGSGYIQRDLDILLLELASVTEYAKNAGITINLEPINRYETSLLNSCTEMMNFLERMGDPDHVGILYDTFHSNIEDENICATVNRICRRISHVHIADSNRRLPGEGHYDFRTLMRKLKSIGYDGFVSLETLPLPSAEAIINGAKRSMQEILING